MFCIVSTAVCDLDLCFDVNVYMMKMLHLGKKQEAVKMSCSLVVFDLVCTGPILSGGLYRLPLNLVDLLMTSPDQRHIKVPGLTVAVATVIGEACPCNCTDISSLFL